MSSCVQTFYWYCIYLSLSYYCSANGLETLLSLVHTTLPAKHSNSTCLSDMVLNMII
jgi:hypothetical protein